jgi:hypothetical protein
MELSHVLVSMAWAQFLAAVRFVKTDAALPESRQDEKAIRFDRPRRVVLSG